MSRDAICSEGAAGKGPRNSTGALWEIAFAPGSVRNLAGVMVVVVERADLADACAAWQGGRGGGSSPIRAAARNLTGVKHYFASDFITRYEDQARGDIVTTRRAAVLLDELERCQLRDAAEWGRVLGVDSEWVGRGIVSGPQDDQILAALQTGTISMPLWGASLDRRVAEMYGSRFVFVLEGPFAAVPAWVHSRIKPEEQELICSGRYSVVGLADVAEDRTLVRLAFESTVPRIS